MLGQQVKDWIAFVDEKSEEFKCINERASVR
jgi:hypothetical protein